MERKEGGFLIALEFWPGGGFTFCSVLLSGSGDDGETFLCAKGGWRVGLRGWKITRSLERWGGRGLMLVPFLFKSPSNSVAAPFINESTG